MNKISIKVTEKDKASLLEIFEMENVKKGDETDLINLNKEGDKVVFVVERRGKCVFVCECSYDQLTRDTNSSTYKQVEMEDLKREYGKLDDSKYINKTEIDKFKKQLTKQYG